MKKIWFVMSSIFIAILGLFLIGNTAKAETLNFSISSVQAENQIDKNSTYFDLLVKPNENQSLTIKIKNDDSQAHKYRVSINRAGTNRNGVIDYSTHGAIPDSSLKNNIESLVPSPKTVTVPANTTQDYTFDLKVPDKSFAGIVLGGIRVQQVDANDQSNSKGVSIKNKFAYVIGLQMRTNEDFVAPDLKLTGVKAKQLDARNYVTANLQNNQPTIIHNLNVTGTVKNKSNNQKVMSIQKDDMTMAPNSNFDLPISTNGQALKAGTYTLQLDAKAEKGKYHWRFNKDFTISDRTAAKLNDSAIDVDQGRNYTLWIIIGIIIVIGLLTIIIYLKRRKQLPRR